MEKFNTFYVLGLFLLVFMYIIFEPFNSSFKTHLSVFIAMIAIGVILLIIETIKWFR